MIKLLFLIAAATSTPSIGRAIDRHFRTETRLHLDPTIRDELIRIDLVEAFGTPARGGGASLQSEVAMRVE